MVRRGYCAGSYGAAPLVRHPRVHPRRCNDVDCVLVTALDRQVHGVQNGRGAAGAGAECVYCAHVCGAGCGALRAVLRWCRGGCGRIAVSRVAAGVAVPAGASLFQFRAWVRDCGDVFRGWCRGGGAGTDGRTRRVYGAGVRGDHGAFDARFDAADGVADADEVLADRGGNCAAHGGCCACALFRGGSRCVRFGLAVGVRRLGAGDRHRAARSTRPRGIRGADNGAIHPICLLYTSDAADE